MLKTDNKQPTSLTLITAGVLSTQTCTKGPLINDQSNPLRYWTHRGTIWWLREATCKLKT